MGLGSILGKAIGGSLAPTKDSNSNATAKAQSGSSAPGQSLTSGPSVTRAAGEQLSTLGSPLTNIGNPETEAFSDRLQTNDTNVPQSIKDIHGASMFDIFGNKGMIDTLNNAELNDLSTVKKYRSNMVNGRDLNTGVIPEAGSGMIRTAGEAGLGLNMSGLKQLSSPYRQTADTGTDILDELKTRM